MNTVNFIMSHRACFKMLQGLKNNLTYNINVCHKQYNGPYITINYCFRLLTVLQ